MPLDADSIAYLDDVKKGKPRHFVMICKGVRIMGMVVYKKGTVERYKKQAKEEGKGQFYHGVVDGKGLNITFKLCREDGYDEPPGKELILKDFLSTETGIRFKPTYEIVEVLPDVAEHDEVEGQEAEGEDQKIPQAPPLPEQGASEQEEKEDESTEDPAVLFNERLKALLPDVKTAAGTPAGDEAKKLINDAGNLARKKDFVQGNVLLEQAHEVLSDWAAEAGNLDRDPAVVFNERLKALLPKVKANAGTLACDEAKRLVGEAGAYAKKKDFGEANSLLDEAEDILEMHGGDDAKTDVDPAVAFNERLKALLPEVKAAAGTPAGDEAKLKVSEAGVFAKKKDFAAANALLDEADAALGQTGASTSTPTDLSAISPGIVKKRKFLLERWSRIPAEVSADLTSLRQAIERDVPDEDVDLLIELSEDYLSDFCDDMKESLDKDINSGDAQYKHAITTIKSFRTTIGSDPLIQHLKSNPLNATVTLDSILLNVLAEVEQALAS